ncbi:MAG: fructosamine kinase family protein [Acidimicrobiales bacterium]
MDRHSGVGRALAQITGSQIAVSTALSGGDVAASSRVTLDDGQTVFAKTHASPPEHFFDTEARGLEWLRAADALPVPAVLGVSDNPPLLVLEWIDEARAKARDDNAFGSGLARLHSANAECFGRPDARTTGSRGLPNAPCDTWPEFYATQRVLPLVRLASASGIYDDRQLLVFESVAARLEIVGGQAEPVARLHGDLWAGNRIVDHTGTSWLIDPACHGGHREFDLAMMRLFGGFDEGVFHAYNDANPLADGWADRVALHQLAPLLLHAIKFGGGYVEAAMTAAQKYE